MPIGAREEEMSFRFRIFKSITLIAMLMQAHLAFADEASVNKIKEVPHIILTGEPLPPISQDEETIVTIDTEELTAADTEKSDIVAKFKEALRTGIDPTPAEGEIYVPLIPTDKSELKYISGFDDHRLEKFLKRKQQGLLMMSKLIKKLKPEKRIAILKKMNTEFFKSASFLDRAVLRPTFEVSINCGFSIMSALIEYLQSKTRLARFLPKSGGIYFALHVGVSVFRTMGPNGKPVSRLELTSELKWLKRTHFIQASVLAIEGTYGIMASPPELTDTFATTTNVSLINVKRGEDLLHVYSSYGIGLPPGGALISSFDSHGPWRRLMLFNLSKLKGPLREKLRSLVYIHPMFLGCPAVFSPKL